MRIVVSSLLAIVLLAISGVDSFPVATTLSSRSSRATKLSAAVIVSTSHPVNDDESTYQHILNQARHYAYSDTTTSHEAKQYLRFILELQSDCVAGTVVGSNICDNNITELVDIVAHLRQKANQQQLIMASSKEMIAMTSVVTMVVAVALLMNTLPLNNNLSPDVVPFTAEEWRWAIRDGYFNTMVAHYMRHGGL